MTTTIEFTSLAVGTTKATRRFHLLVTWKTSEGTSHKAIVAGSNDLFLAYSLARGECKARCRSGARYADARIIDTADGNSVVDVVRVWR